MYATIINGRVSEVTDSMPAPGSMFMECGGDVAPGWMLAGGGLLAPEPQPGPNPNAALDARIITLEAAQHRATRELLLGTGTEVLAEAEARLAETDALITALRARRV